MTCHIPGDFKYLIKKEDMRKGIIIIFIFIIFFFNCLKDRDNPLDPDADLLLMIRRISDFDYNLDFGQMKYFSLNNSNPIDVGTLKIYLDDHNDDNNIGTRGIVYLNQTNECDYLINGADYIVNYDSGFVQFKRLINTTHDIFVTYSHNGTNYPYIDPSTNYHIDYQAKITNMAEIFTFLYRNGTVSPYEYKGIYNTGITGIDTINKYFGLYILDKYGRKLSNQPFTRRNSLSYTYSGPSYASYYVDLNNGYLIFDVSKPFEFPNSYYHDHPEDSPYINNPNPSKSYYYIHIEYRK